MTVMQSHGRRGKTPCHKCQERGAMHSVGDRELCCECYVKEGHLPADWHPECMETYKNLKGG